MTTTTTSERLAEEREQTKSDVLRDLTQGKEERPQSAYDRLRPFIGIAPSGDGTLSRNTGERFCRMLKEKHRSRCAD